MGEIRDIDGKLVFCGEFKNGDKFLGDYIDYAKKQLFIGTFENEIRISGFL